MYTALTTTAYKISNVKKNKLLSAQQELVNEKAERINS